MTLDKSRAEEFREHARQIRAKAANCLFPGLKAEFELMAAQWEMLAKIESGECIGVAGAVAMSPRPSKAKLSKPKNG